MNGRTEVTVLDLLGQEVLDADGRSLGRCAISRRNGGTAIYG